MLYRLRGFSGLDWTCSDISWSPARRGAGCQAAQPPDLNLAPVPLDHSSDQQWPAQISQGTYLHLGRLNAQMGKHIRPPATSLPLHLQHQGKLQKSSFYAWRLTNRENQIIAWRACGWAGHACLQRLGAFNSRQGEELICLLPRLCLSQTHMWAGCFALHHFFFSCDSQTISHWKPTRCWHLSREN